jgi:hypothetical protein
MSRILKMIKDEMRREGKREMEFELLFKETE